MLNRLYEPSFAHKFTTGLNTDPEAQKLRRVWMLDPMLVLVQALPVNLVQPVLEHGVQRPRCQ